MKNTLKLVLTLTAVSALAMPVLRAEDAPAAPAAKPDRPERRGPGGPGGERGERGGDPAARLERATKDLGLSADQAAQWKALDEKQQAAMEAIRNDSTIAREDKRAKAMESMKSFGDQRRAILTADQQKKFDEMQSRRGGRGGPGGPGGPEGREGRGGRDRQGPPPDMPPPGK